MNFCINIIQLTSKYPIPIRRKSSNKTGNCTMRIDYSTLTLKEDETFDMGDELNTTSSTLSFLSDDDI